MADAEHHLPRGSQNRSRVERAAYAPRPRAACRRPVVALMMQPLAAAVPSTAGPLSPRWQQLCDGWLRRKKGGSHGSWEFAPRKMIGKTKIVCVSMPTKAPLSSTAHLHLHRAVTIHWDGRWRTAGSPQASRWGKAVLGEPSSVMTACRISPVPSLSKNSYKRRVNRTLQRMRMCSGRRQRR